MSSAASDRDAEVYFRGESHHPVVFKEFRMTAMTAIPRDHGDLIPPDLFQFLLQTNHLSHSTLARSLGGPCITPGSRLGDPIPIPVPMRSDFQISRCLDFQMSRFCNLSAAG
jgi:hypothetical protein